MAKEIEAKFINIDKKVMISKLEKLGAKKLFDERLLRRCTYNLPCAQENAWARVRDEVEKVTMTYKCINSQSLDGVEEVELIIDDFERGREFLKSLGLTEKAYQESKRIRYVLPEENVEFDIDTWPGLEPWIEIESDTEEKVKKYSKLLGFDWNSAMFGSSDIVYVKIYNIDKDWICNKCPVLKFGELPTQLGKNNLRK